MSEIANNSEQRNLLELSCVKKYFSENPKALWTLELIASAIVSIVIGILFSRYARGGPISTDTTLYMNLGLNGIKMPFVLNRYFHIFLQGIFLRLASHPMEGYHNFWGFLIGINSFMIYFSARKVLKTSNFLHGILAVLLFFSLKVLADISGIIVVDFTAMTMIMALVSVYIISVNKAHTNPWIIGLLGFLFFLGFKTKEVTLSTGVLFIGLGWVNNEKFNLKSLIKNLLWVFCGLFVGMIFLMFLNLLFLKDIFFGFRFSEWQEFLGTYAASVPSVLHLLNSLQDGNIDDWYKGFWFRDTLLPFFFYIVSGIRIRNKTDDARKLLWLVPLVHIVVLIISINNRFGYIGRFGLPIIPVICILASQFINFKSLSIQEDRKKIALYFGVGLFLSLGIRVLFSISIPSRGMDLGAVVTLVYYPLLFTLLLGSLFFFHKTVLSNVINWLIVFSLLISPLASNLRAMFVFKENFEDFSRLMTPYSEFNENIRFSQNMKFYLSEDIFRKKNVDEILTLFNIYFDANATRDNFIISDGPTSVFNDVITSNYDYVLLTRSDWRSIENYDEKVSQITNIYQIVGDSKGAFYLLIGQ